MKWIELWSGCSLSMIGWRGRCGGSDRLYVYAVAYPAYFPPRFVVYKVPVIRGDDFSFQ
jgi:hypothetical protein